MNIIKVVVKNILRLAFLTMFVPISACSAQEVSNVNSNAVVGDYFRDCAECPELVVVPQIGHTSRDPGRVFYAGRFEVTWANYLHSVRDGFCPAPTDDGKRLDFDDSRISDSYPLTFVSPTVFTCYLKWLNKKTGKPYRIPSALEWENIARAGTTSEYYWGDGLGHDNAIVFGYFDIEGLRLRLGYPASSYVDDPRSDVKWGRVYPVGLFKPNPWGLYDVIGNAAEVTAEPAAPLPACLKYQPTNVCSRVTVRGVGRARIPFPMRPNPPITQSLMTARFFSPANGGTYFTGYRIVRD